LSEDFERHTQIPQDSEFDREQQENANNANNNDEIDLNDPDLEKAATRIQASFRGFKTRKGLGSDSNQNLQEEDQAPTTLPPAPEQQQEEENQDNTNTRRRISLDSTKRNTFSFYFQF